MVVDAPLRHGLRRRVLEDGLLLPLPLGVSTINGDRDATARAYRPLRLNERGKRRLGTCHDTLVTARKIPQVEDHKPRRAVGHASQHGVVLAEPPVQTERGAIGSTQRPLLSLVVAIGILAELSVLSFLGEA